MRATVIAEATRVLVVEDRAASALAIRLWLWDSGFEVDVVGDERDAISVCGKRRPDLVLLDMNGNGPAGWEACRRLHEATGVPIIIVSVLDSAEDKVRGLMMGADDYVSKPFDPKELLARIRAILRRQRTLARGADLTFSDILLRHDTREVFRGGARLELTAKEFDLLELFMLHPRRLLARDTVLDCVWGESHAGAENLVDVYVSHLRRKLGEPQVIQTVRGGGFVLRTDARRELASAPLQAEGAANGAESSRTAWRPNCDGA